MRQVLLIGTFETKKAELQFFADALVHQGVKVVPLDVSLVRGPDAMTDRQKLEAMAQQSHAASEHIAQVYQDYGAVVGVGGGTGSELVLGAMKKLPATYPKVLVTTLAFDPRPVLADTSITIIPTLCDVEGLNSSLRQVFENAAAVVAGLSRRRSVVASDQPPIAITTLGATGFAGTEVARLLTASGFEPTVFHANGFGGAAFTRFIEDGHAKGILDLNIHELGRIRFGGAHVPMQHRFSAGATLPRVVLPGGLNFLGLGAFETLSEAHKARPLYRHTEQFTHVKLTEAEMADQAEALAHLLNAYATTCHVILPMGGFSHEDRPGGAIEDANLREIAAKTLEQSARGYATQRIDHHINSTDCAHIAVKALIERMPHG